MSERKSTPHPPTPTTRHPHTCFPSYAIQQHYSWSGTRMETEVSWFQSGRKHSVSIFSFSLYGPQNVCGRS